jgi:hypothetical protein
MDDQSRTEQLANALASSGRRVISIASTPNEALRELHKLSDKEASLDFVVLGRLRTPGAPLEALSRQSRPWETNCRVWV